MNASLQWLFGQFRHRPYVSVQVVLVLLLAAGNYFLWRQREAATARHALVRQEGDEMLHALANYPRIQSDLTAVTDALQLIDRNLVVERTLEVNLGYFFEMETASRVHLRELNQLGVPPSPEGNPFKIVPFSLTATGSYGQLVNFMRNLETGPRLLRLTHCSLSRGDEKTEDMVLDLTVESLGHP